LNAKYMLYVYVGCLDDLKKCLGETGVDGVMTSEALLENPALFCELENLPNQKVPSQIEIAKEYLELAQKYKTTPKMKRAHLFKMLHGTLKVHTDIRAKLGRAPADEFPNLIAELESLHAAMELRPDNENRNESQVGPKCSHKLCQPFRENGSWYVRHRDRNKKMIAEREEKKRKSIMATTSPQKAFKHI